MANYYTTTDLLQKSKDRGMIPTTQDLYTNADLFEIGDDEIAYGLIPLILACREEYYVKDYDQTTVNGTNNYSIPPRAIGGRLRDAYLLDSSSNKQRLTWYNPSEVGNYSQNGTPLGFYFKSNEIILTPTPNAAQTLRQQYFIRPSQLVPVSACAIVTATASNYISTTSTLPNNFTVSKKLDIVKSTPHFDFLGIDQVISSTASGTITFTASIPTGVNVGDYVCIAEETCVPQIPKEFHNLLPYKIAYRVLMDLNDPNADKIAKEISRLEQALQSLISPRDDGGAKVLFNQGGIFDYVSGCDQGWKF